MELLKFKTTNVEGIENHESKNIEASGGATAILAYKIRQRRKDKSFTDKGKKIEEQAVVNEESSQTLRVAFPIFGKPLSYINEKGEKSGMIWEIWSKVWDRLLIKYPQYRSIKLDYIIIEDPVVDDLFRGIVNNKYDILIGDFTPNAERLSFSLFTEPIFTEKLVGVYKNTDDSGMSLDYSIWIKIFYILRIPLLIFIIISFIMAIQGYFYRNSKKTTFLDVYAQALNAIFNDGGGKLNGNVYRIITGKNYLQWVFIMIIIIISFASLFFLQTVAISKSLDIIEKNRDPFAFPNGKRVLVPKTFENSEELKKCCGIKTVESNNNSSTTDSLAKEYEKRRIKDGLIGFFQTSTLVDYWIEKNEFYAVSPTTFAEPSEVSFVISKTQPQYLQLINESLHYLKWNGTLNKICKNYLNRFCTQPMNISVFFK